MKDMSKLWEEAEALKAGEREMLAEIGAAYLELEKLTNRQKVLQDKVQDTRNILEATQTSLEAAINALVKEAGVEDGDVTLDFKNKRIVLVNG